MSSLPAIHDNSSVQTNVALVCLLNTSNEQELTTFETLYGLIGHLL